MLLQLFPQKATNNTCTSAEVKNHGKAKKDGKYINIFMIRELAERLGAYSLETGIPKTFLIEKAVKKYLDEKEKQGDE